MTDEQYWWLILGLFAAVVVVVAVLLGWIIAAARSIDRHAREIWTTGKQIAGNTVSIGLLRDTNRRLRRLGESADSLERSLESLGERVARLPPGGAAGGERP